MATPLLSTKLYFPPDTKKHVPRQRLIERLNAGLWEAHGFERRLTLVSAPAGYGKTTLVTQWLRSTNYPCAWLSLDENDNDPKRFLEYLVAALTQIDPSIGDCAQGLLKHPQPPPSDEILTALVNDIAAHPAAIVLAIDDYHLIQTQSIHQQLNFLLEFQPSNLHLVIMTREDPPVPLSRLRARSQVTEIRQVDLCFTEVEAGVFLRKGSGLELQEEDIQALVRRTEGWVVGLQLAALSLQGQTDLKGFIQSFTGSNRFILDYLMDEVLDRQPTDTLDFLLRTSILERLSAPLCDSVCERTGSREMLEALESANLFIFPLDARRAWYRYHRLFAEHLRHRLRVSANVPEHALHTSASLWFEENGYLAEAVQHALSAENWERAVGLIQGISQDLMKRGEVATLLGWFQSLPEEEVLAHPQLCVDFSWPLVLSGQLEAAEALVERVEARLDDESQLSGDIAALHAYIARSRGDTRRTVMMSRRALSMLPDENQGLREILAVNLGIAHWHEGEIEEAEEVLTDARDVFEKTRNRYAELTALIFLNRIQAARGHLRGAYQAYKPLVEIKGDIPVLALAHMDLGALHYERNELEDCGRQFRASMAVSERTRNGEFLIGGYAQMVRLHLASGNLAGAINALQVTERLLQEHRITPVNLQRNAALHVEVALIQGDLTGAEAWAEQAGKNADAHNFYPFLGLTPARILLAQKRNLEALEYLQSRFDSALEGGWGYGRIAVRVMQAQAATNPEEALGYLVEALQWGQPEGFLRTFVDAGEGLTPLLQEAALRGASPDYIGNILAAMEGRERGASPGQQPLVEPLSEREIEVLRLVAAGLSNREIASKLILSMGTVKSHIHHIYGKLDTRNRAQAIARARELNLL